MFIITLFAYTIKVGDQKESRKYSDGPILLALKFNTLKFNERDRNEGVVEQRRKAIKDEFDKESGEDGEDEEDKEDEKNELNRRVEEKLGRKVEVEIRRRIALVEKEQFSLNLTRSNIGRMMI
ncbi:hypothetical protein RhiirA1_475060 [Rhizophagus irregularis]|uniref:Uncharacterized protein n=2 Tax=Rhizophagus irregularis TaxID=588596 RepID=A0A2N0QXI0_9GLOM|nr:hypothetical protein RhiirA1_475060 [Rhizophagus irregularis]GET54991.1 hypothetical protein RIR_jg14861.t1 [Rhizophagus irregularis DAOM 181602=DAOM 197198]